MTEKKEDRWFLNFKCDCDTEYSFEVTEIKVPTNVSATKVSATKGSETTKNPSAFFEEREYCYNCKKCGKYKIVIYTYENITHVELEFDEG